MIKIKLLPWLAMAVLATALAGCKPHDTSDSPAATNAPAMTNAPGAAVPAVTNAPAMTNGMNQ